MSTEKRTFRSLETLRTLSDRELGELTGKEVCHAPAQ